MSSLGTVSRRRRWVSLTKHIRRKTQENRGKNKRASRTSIRAALAEISHIRAGEVASGVEWAIDRTHNERTDAILLLHFPNPPSEPAGNEKESRKSGQIVRGCEISGREKQYDSTLYVLYSDQARSWEESRFPFTLTKVPGEVRGRSEEIGR